MKLKTLTLCLCAAAFAGCANLPSTMSLKTQEQPELDNVSGTLFVPQSGLDVTVVPTNAAAGGLLGVLVAAGIDAARRSAAEKSAAPILDQLHDYDFRTVLKDASNQAVGPLTDVKFGGPLDLESIDSKSQRRVIYDQSNAKAVLFVNVGYRLISGNLYVSANAVMYPKASALQQFRVKPNETDPLDAGNAIYRKTFNYAKQNVAAADIKDDLTEGANSIAKQLASDLSHPL